MSTGVAVLMSLSQVKFSHKTACNMTVESCRKLLRMCHDGFCLLHFMLHYLEDAVITSFKHIFALC